MRRCIHCNEFMKTILSRDGKQYAEYCNCGGPCIPGHCKEVEE